MHKLSAKKLFAKADITRIKLTKTTLLAEFPNNEIFNEVLVPFFKEGYERAENEGRILISVLNSVFTHGKPRFILTQKVAKSLVKLDKNQVHKTINGDNYSAFLKVYVKCFGETAPKPSALFRCLHPPGPLGSKVAGAYELIDDEEFYFRSYLDKLFGTEEVLRRADIFMNEYKTSPKTSLTSSPMTSPVVVSGSEVVAGGVTAGVDGTGIENLKSVKNEAPPLGSSPGGSADPHYNREDCLRAISTESKIILERGLATKNELFQMLKYRGVTKKEELSDEQVRELHGRLKRILGSNAPGPDRVGPTSPRSAQSAMTQVQPINPAIDAIRRRTS